MWGETKKQSVAESDKFTFLGKGTSFKGIVTFALLCCCPYESCSMQNESTSISTDPKMHDLCLIIDNTATIASL